MSAPGYILVKDGDKNRRFTYKEFYGPLDKGSAKPSFCYPQRKASMEEDIRKMERALESGYISKEREMEAKIRLRTKKERLDKINEQEETARKLFTANKDVLIKRREELAEDIRSAMPSRDSVNKRITNPFTVLKREKGGLEEKKKEYIVLSRLAGEESNVTFLQKDKDSD
jgi:hypothetical protein